MIDSRIAWLLGVIQGDGYVGRYFVEVSDKYEENSIVPHAHRPANLKELAGEHHKGWSLRLNWSQRQESYRGRQQDDGQADDLARRAERRCMAVARHVHGLRTVRGKIAGAMAWASSCREMSG